MDDQVLPTLWIESNDLIGRIRMSGMLQVDMDPILRDAEKVTADMNNKQLPLFNKLAILMNFVDKNDDGYVKIDIMNQARLYAVRLNNASRPSRVDDPMDTSAGSSSRSHATRTRMAVAARTKPVNEHDVDDDEGGLDDEDGGALDDDSAAALTTIKTASMKAHAGVEKLVHLTIENTPSASLAITKDKKQASYTQRGLREKRIALISRINIANTMRMEILSAIETYMEKTIEACEAKYGYTVYSQELSALQDVRNQEKEELVSRLAAIEDIKKRSSRYKERQDAIAEGKKRKVDHNVVKKKTIFDLVG
jgi:hypothetical protein